MSDKPDKGASTCTLTAGLKTATTSPAHPFSAVQSAKPPTHRAALPAQQTCLNTQGSGGTPAAGAATDRRRPCFRLDRVSLAANFVARAELQNGMMMFCHRLPHPAAVPQLGPWLDFAAG
ncbi:MAG: hypothetical protein R2830_26480 [Saprospiraceae bacterium]